MNRARYHVTRLGGVGMKTRLGLLSLACLIAGCGSTATESDTDVGTKRDIPPATKPDTDVGTKREIPLIAYSGDQDMPPDAQVELHREMDKLFYMKDGRVYAALDHNFTDPPETFVVECHEVNVICSKRVQPDYEYQNGLKWMWSVEVRSGSKRGWLKQGWSPWGEGVFGRLIVENRNGKVKWNVTSNGEDEPLTEAQRAELDNHPNVTIDDPPHEPAFNSK